MEIETNIPLFLQGRVKNTKDQDVGKSVCFLVYGKSGTGKTHIIQTLPKPFVFSFESGLLTLREQDIDFTEATIGDATEIVLWVHSGQCPYDSIVIDSITAMYNKVLKYYKNLKDEKGVLVYKDTRQAYMHTQEFMVSFMEDLISSCSIQNINLLLICHEGRVEDEINGGSYIGPEFAGRKVGQKSPYMVDEVFRMVSETREGVLYRYLVTQPTAQTEGKDRSGTLGLYELPDLGEILAKIIKGERTNDVTENEKTENVQEQEKTKIIFDGEQND